MAASCGAAVRGLSIDFLISAVGWTKTTSFVKHYLKPIRLKENLVKTGESKEGEQKEKCRKRKGKTSYIETNDKCIRSKGQVPTLSSTHQKFDSKLEQISATVVRKHPSLWSIVEKYDERQVNGFHPQIINKSNESINQGSTAVNINTTGKIMQSSKDNITKRGVVGMLNDQTSGVVNKTNDKLMTVEIPQKLKMPITRGANRVRQIAQGSEED